MALAIDGNEEDARQRLWMEPLPLALPKAMQAEDRRIGRIALLSRRDAGRASSAQKSLADLRLRARYAGSYADSGGVVGTGFVKVIAAAGASGATLRPFQAAQR